MFWTDAAVKSPDLLAGRARGAESGAYVDAYRCTTGHTSRECFLCGSYDTSAWRDNEGSPHYHVICGACGNDSIGDSAGHTGRESDVADRMAVVAGPANAALGIEVAALLQSRTLTYDCQRFPDGETQVDLRESVRGRHVYLLQSTSPPVEQHLIELLLLADACRRAGAERVTGVIPYFGYARQERRTDRRSLGARVAADIVATGGFERLMLIDVHTPAIEGFFDVPIDHLTAVPLLAAAARGRVAQAPIVVAPDLGAVKLAREYSQLLAAPMAFVHKIRLSGREVEARAVIGDVRNRTPVIVDDMLSTGGTVEAAARALRQAGAIDPVTVVATHALLVGDARTTLRRASIAHLIVGNTVAIEDPRDVPLDVVSVAPLIAAAMRRDYQHESLADLRVHR
jgi:ribose-phosphate pyrophosphokinase